MSQEPELRYTWAHHKGRLYKTCREFLSNTEANDFLEKNPDYGVLFVCGTITVAHNDDKGEIFDSPLNEFKKYAQGWNDEGIYKNDLWLYFDNFDDFKKTAELIKHLEHIGIESPKDAPTQLKYTIHIEKLSDYFTKKPAAILWQKFFRELGVDFLTVGDYGGCDSTPDIVVKTLKKWSAQQINEVLKKADMPYIAVEHPLTNLLTNVFDIKVVEK